MGLGTVLLFHLVDFILLNLFSGVPALGGHFVVNVALHSQGFGQGLSKGLVDTEGGGFQGAVEKQVAGPFFQLKPDFPLNCARSW